MSTPDFTNDPVGFLLHENSALRTKLRFAEVEIKRLSGTRDEAEVHSAPYCSPTTELVAAAFTHF